MILTGSEGSSSDFFLMNRLSLFGCSFNGYFFYDVRKFLQIILLFSFTCIVLLKEILNRGNLPGVMIMYRTF
jgi:hypothetical protein